MESMGELKRSHSCNDLGAENIDQEVTLMGWVLRRRDHGGVIFIDLRDRWGITQVVFNPEFNSEVHAKAHALRSEWVLAVKGRVFSRPDGMMVGGYAAPPANGGPSADSSISATTASSPTNNTSSFPAR